MSSSAEKGTVSIAFVRKAVEALRRQDIDPQPVLRRSGIPATLLQSDQSRVAAAQYSALWLAVASVLDDEFFGLDSRRMKVGSFATLCRLVVHSERLHEALARAISFFNLLLDDTQLSADTAGETAGDGLLRIVVTHRSTAAPIDRVFADETILILLHGVLCWLAGRRIAIRQAQFAYPRPVWWMEYRAMYSADLCFEQPTTQLLLDASCLDIHVKQNDKTTREFLRQAPYNIILKYKDERSWSVRIHRRLRNSPPPSWPTFEALAAEWRVAASTLHRRLETEGTSYQRIKDGLRRDLAINFLSTGDESVASIAAALGFAETSAFHRAFKQWTGVRPGDYRRHPAAAHP